MNEYLCEFRITERDRLIFDLATRYHDECEAYDAIVCTGRGRYGAMPVNSHEMALINRNAIAVKKRIYLEAEQRGISKDEIRKAIARCA